MSSRDQRKQIPGICSYRKCTDPVTDLPKKPTGRQSSMCTKHYLQFQVYTETRRQKIEKQKECPR